MWRLLVFLVTWASLLAPSATAASSTAGPFTDYQCTDLEDDLADSQVLLVGRCSERLWILLRSGLQMYSAPLSALTSRQLTLDTTLTPTSLNATWPVLTSDGTFSRLYAGKPAGFARAVSVIASTVNSTNFVFATANQGDGASLKMVTFNDDANEVTVSQMGVTGGGNRKALRGSWLSSSKVDIFYTAVGDTKERGRLTVKEFKLDWKAQKVTPTSTRELVLCIAWDTSKSDDHYTVQVMAPGRHCASPPTTSLSPIEHGFEYAGRLYLFATEGVLILPMGAIDGQPGASGGSHYSATWLHYPEFLICRRLPSSTQANNMWKFIMGAVVLIIASLIGVVVCIFTMQHLEPQVAIKKPIPGTSPPTVQSGKGTCDKSKGGNAHISQSYKVKHISSLGKGVKVVSPKSKFARGPKSASKSKSKSVKKAPGSNMGTVKSSLSKQTVLGSKLTVQASKQTVLASKQTVLGSKQTVLASKQTVLASKATLVSAKQSHLGGAEKSASTLKTAASASSKQTSAASVAVKSQAPSSSALALKSQVKSKQ